MFLKALLQEELALGERGLGGRFYKRVENPDLDRPEDSPSSNVAADRSKRQVYVNEFERGVVVGELAERIRELETEEVIFSSLFTTANVFFFLFNTLISTS